MLSRNLVILILAQALGLAGISAVVLLGGIIGIQLAPTPALATLPSSVATIGTALSIIPASALMSRVGRRAGFIGGALVAVSAALLAVLAIYRGSFGLFCGATLLIGANSAFMQQYRFAATESVGSQYAGQAVSLVLIGGIAAGYLGPEMARRTSALLPWGEFSGSFAGVALLYAAAAGLLFFLRDPQPAVNQPGEEATARPRRLVEIFTQPDFLLAVLCATVAYGVMTFVMTATPVQMNRVEGFDLGQTALVIQSHIVAMFLPSLFSGALIARLGERRVMLIGLACLFATVTLGAVSRDLLHYWGTLVLLGLGWNLLYVGATVMLTSTYRPQERFKAQAANDFTVLGVQTLASLSAGSVLFYTNWEVLVLTNLPILALTFAALLWRGRAHRGGTAPQAS